MIREFLAVGIGGAAGSMARHALSGLVAAGCLAGGFPVGTFAVNAAGSLLIGAVTGYASQQALVPLLAGVGFCGGFTTFSTFRPTRCGCCAVGNTAPRRFTSR